MHIVPRGHIKTDQSISSYFVTLSLEYPKAPCLISMFNLSGKVPNSPFRFRMQVGIMLSCKVSSLAFSFLEVIRYPKYINIAHFGSSLIDGQFEKEK